MFNLDENYYLRVVEDKETLWPLIEEMHKESPYKDYPLRDTAAQNAHVVIGLYCNEVLVGFLAGLLIDHPIIDIKMSFENGYYVYPEHRHKHSHKLIEAYEVWAKMNGAKIAQVMHMNTPKVGKLYEKLGYKLSEMSYLKELN